MRIEEGKTYLDAHGNRVGPMTLWDLEQEHSWSWDRPDGDQIYRDDGTSNYNPELVAVIESPVRTVTRQEIIPGTYDGVIVTKSTVPGKVHALIPHEPFVGGMDHTALTRAAAVLTALAEALRDGE